MDADAARENDALSRRRAVEEAYTDPRTGLGSMANTLKAARLQNPFVTREDVKAYFETLRDRQDRPQRGYNSFVPQEPMHEVQVDLAFMSAFGGKPYPYLLVAIDSFSKKVAAEPLKDRNATTTAAAMRKIIDKLGIPAQVYSDDGGEFKKEFKQLLHDFDIEKQVTRGHAFFVERVIRTIKEAILRRMSQGVGRRGQWHLLLHDIIHQINNREHAATGVTPNEAYENPNKAQQAWESMKNRAQNTAEPRAIVTVGDRVKLRLKPQESRASYRVNELKWSEKVYRVLEVMHSNLGPRYRLEGWAEPAVRRDIRKVSEAEDARPRRLEVQSRLRRRQQAQADRLPPMI